MCNMKCYVWFTSCNHFRLFFIISAQKTITTTKVMPINMTKVMPINRTNASNLNNVIDHRSYIIGCGAFFSVMLVGLLFIFICKSSKR